MVSLVNIYISGLAYLLVLVGRGAQFSSAVVASFHWFIRAIRLSLENIDIKLEQAAQTLGASAWRVFLQ